MKRLTNHYGKICWRGNFFRFFLFALLAGNCLAASDTAARFDEANKLFEQGKFSDAAAAYEKIMATRDESPAIYFNLGNAYFKSGQMGRAIIAYRQAERLAPRDPDVRANLQFARNQVQGPTVRPTFSEKALGKLTLNEWAGLTAAGVWLTFLSLAAMQLRPELKPALRTATAVSGGAAIIFAVCLAFAFSNGTAKDVVVVIGKDATVRISPYDEAASTFTARDGAELRSLDKKNDWVQVTDANRRIGWLKQDAVALLNRE